MNEFDSDGRQDGLWKYVDHGIRYEGNYKNGNRHGVWVEIWEEGKYYTRIRYDRDWFTWEVITDMVLGEKQYKSTYDLYHKEEDYE